MVLGKISSRSAAGRNTVGMLLIALSLVGCGKNQESVRGVAPGAEANTTVAQLAHAKAASAVVLTGEMTEKCPIAGCWFMLRDKTGVVRVDTKSAGFVVSDVPVHTHLTVAGKVLAGSEPSLSATGLRY